MRIRDELRTRSTPDAGTWFTVEADIVDLSVCVDRGAVLAIDLNRRAQRGPESELEHRVSTELLEYFAGDRTSFDVMVRPRGTAFAQRVWDALRSIPYGATRTYGEIARLIGNPEAARAVGTANGRNPIPIVIPCHRVVAAGGKLGGYGGGLKLKRALLDLETRHTAPFGQTS